MAIPDAKLVLLPYLQNWDGQTLNLRVLLSPRDALIEPFVGEPPPWPGAFFPAAAMTFHVRFSPGLQDMPKLTDGVDVGTVSFGALPSAQAIFVSLKKQFTFDPAPPAPQSLGRVRKHLPLTYQNASGYAPADSDQFTTDNTYSCYLKQQNPAHQYKPLNLPKTFNPSWGKLIASILRIPQFAEQTGLIRTCAVRIDPSLLKQGGFLFFVMDPATATQMGMSSSDYKTYSTRIPETDGNRGLFSPVFFPLVTAAGASSAAGHSEIFAEVDEYDDGWAKTVHCVQPQQSSPIKEEPDGTRPVRDLGVRLGWDDEQVTVWLDRQLSSDHDFDCPLGVHGYRIDVRAAGLDPWLPLTQAQGNFGQGLGSNNTFLGTFSDQLAVEIHPSQSMDETTTDFWMPMYFANWTGSALVGRDEFSLRLLGQEKPLSDTEIKGVPPQIDLRYGRSYEFRVRLMDHTGGGPSLESTTTSLGPNPVSKAMRFRRWVRPLAPVIVNDIPVIGPDPDSESAPLNVEVKRPGLSWPAVAFTGAYTNVETQLQAQLTADRQNFPDPETRPETTLPDPNAKHIEISLWVNTLPQDPLATDGTYAFVYSTRRPMPTDFFASATLNFDWRPCKDVWNPKDGSSPSVFWNSASTSGPIVVPTARLLRLRIRIVCDDDRDSPVGTYFGADDVRFGPDAIIPLRKNATAEDSLYVSDVASDLISAYFLQTPPLPTVADQTVPVAGNAVSRLATELRLRAVGTALRSAPGDRVVFACSGALRHVLGPDRASISFPSDSDLIRQWLVIIRLSMVRDWTWDNLKVGGIVVRRHDQSDTEIIRFSPTYSAGLDAIAGASTDRNQTHFVIIDAIDPKPVGGADPTELHPSYTIETSYLSAPTPPVINCDIRLPVATAPTQIPKIASVGFAMSPFTPDPLGYAFTSTRKRIVWVEFEEQLRDNQDRYFARVLRSAPDPLLVNSEFVTPEVIEPDLPIDAEIIRRFVPQQANDDSGLIAMQPMIPSSSPLHWGLPLPEGLDENSPELFGFFTYEFRIGHYNDHNIGLDRWSTAQARFSAPLRVAGVQHPYPMLPCNAFRSFQGIVVSAPHAQPAPKDSIRPNLPSTMFCFLLYAQATQIDGSGQRRNVLVNYQHARALTRRDFSDTADTVPTAVASDPDNALDPQLQQLVAFTVFSDSDTATHLEFLGFKGGRIPLSAMAVELENQASTEGRGVIDLDDPLGGNLGSCRIYRASNLVAVAAAC